MELINIRNIGAKTLEKLNANGIYTPRDLLLRFPKKYSFFYVDNYHAFDGEIHCFKCKVASIPVIIKTRGNSKAYVFYAIVNGYKTKCIIFSGDFLRYKLIINKEIICYGKYKAKEKEFSVLSIFFDDFQSKLEVDYGFKDISNKLLENAVKMAIESGVRLEDNLPLEYIEKYHLLSINDLILKAHFPENEYDCKQVRRRVRYEDFFWYTIALEGLKQLRGLEEKEAKLFNRETINLLIKNLPFELTIDQKTTINEILDDLGSNKIMNRLVEGDVGSGKSMVAFIASIAAILSGYQVAIMAPTEILANQHHQNFMKLFPQYSCALLTSSIKQKEKDEILFKLLHNRINLIIGTHALLNEKVIFSKLGLVIIDEQHRFGVQQRKGLIDKYKGIDCLYMTATPIPRTLGLTSFGDLDLSLIKTMPKNRKPVITKIIPMDALEVLKDILIRHLENKEQIYVVVPIIDQSSNLNCIDVKSAYDIFSKMLPNRSLAIIHGKMKSSEKDEIMNKFKKEEIDCLISTTVIEVGLDNKNATIMVILNAERYGLSQIHQLRGRVGRGALQSYCYLVTNNEDQKRLQILTNVNDGFLLAEEDLKLRGPGDYLGDEQSGFNSLAFDYESNDLVIWQCALNDSKEYMNNYLKNGQINRKIEDIFAKINNKLTKIN